MPTVAVIPVKSFVLGKQRLSSAVDPATRAQLGRRLADHVASTVAASGLIPLIVTADSQVAEWSTMAGFPSIADPGQGLDAAATAGMEWAMESRSRWFVLHSDLPLVTKSDLSSLRAPLEDGRPVIAPSSDGGTSAIGSLGPVVFSFGPSSFQRHLTALEDPVIVARAGLLLDVDSPGDLEAAAKTARGRWLLDLIAGSDAPETSQNLY